MIEEMVIDKIKIALKLQPNTRILVYIRSDESSSYILIKDLDFATYQNKKTYTMRHSEISQTALGNITEFQLKIELVSGSDGSINAYTPSV